MAFLQGEFWLVAGQGFGSGENDAITLGRVDNWGKLGSVISGCSLSLPSSGSVRGRGLKCQQGRELLGWNSLPSYHDCPLPHHHRHLLHQQLHHIIKLSSVLEKCHNMS